jgi:NAD(P)-dependent dehydrogenase (short-subunit alcohol dehydrogenase family)
VSDRLEGKVTIVTGAATGIGKAIATALAADGARVVVNHLNTPDRADAVVATITGRGGEAIAVEADVGERADYVALVDQTIERFGRWDMPRCSRRWTVMRLTLGERRTRLQRLSVADLAGDSPRVRGELPSPRQRRRRRTPP